MKLLLRRALPTLVFASVAMTCFTNANAASVYRAFSLVEAQRQLQAKGKPAAEVSEVGGITRPIALVLDASQKDILLIGEADPTKEPMSMDDVVVAMRAILKYEKEPLVSIERSMDTDQTGKQFVRFDGGIENTRFGKDLLECDVLLKKMGLGLLPIPAMGVKSYAEMAADKWKATGGQETFVSRFWFLASDTSQVESGDGVALLEDMAVSVKTELIGTNSDSPNKVSRDEVGEAFAADISGQIEVLSTKHHVLRRLGPLFRIVGLMEALADWRKEGGRQLPDLGYWLDEYRVPIENTPKDVDLLIAPATTREQDHVQLILDGGVDTTVLLTEWKAHSKEALQELVLLARPKNNPLSWPVPLDEEPNPQLLSAIAKISGTKGSGEAPKGASAMTLRGRIKGFDGAMISQPILKNTPPSPSASSKPGWSVNVAPTKPNSSSNGVQAQKVLISSAGDVRTAVGLAGNGRTVVVAPSGAVASSIAAKLGAQTNSTNVRIITNHESPFESNGNAIIKITAAATSGVSPTNPEKLVADDVGYRTGRSYVRAFDPPPWNNLKFTRAGGGNNAIGSTLPSTGGQNGSSVPGAISGNGFPTPRVNGVMPPHVGGVMLRGAAEAADADSELTAGDFSLIFDGAKNEIDVASLRRFVTALWATYFTEVGPGISIDPVGKMTDRHAVRYIGNVINSDLGRVMREADYIMKSWAVGSSRPDVPKWMTPEDYAHEQGVFHLARSRFWFIPENMVFRRAGDGLIFESGRMRVKTEYMLSAEERAAKAKGEDKKEEPGASPENEKWAEQFTRRYGELAAKYPVFDELYEYARQVSLAKYLKQSHIPLLWFMLANREMVLTEDSPGTVEAFARRSKYVHEIEIAGGVDLAPSLSEGRFVVDEKLAALLNAARAAAPEPSPKDGSASPRPHVDVVNEGPDNLTVAPSRTVVISDSADGGDFVTDLGMRIGKEPSLELARFRRSDQPQVQTFGRDWHLLIPYSIRPGSPKRIPFAKAQVPETMILRNLLSGREETFHFDDQKYKIAGYIPDDSKTNINIGLFFLTDGSYRLADKLGCQFEFDHAGRLTEMLLEDHYHISYQYGEKVLTWKDFHSQPYRLAREGTEYVTLRNVRFPARLRLFDEATGEEELFTYAADNAEGIAGYLPDTGARSGYRILAILSDASLLLKHRSGAEFAFNTSGEFTSQLAYFLASLRQNNHEVAFKYDIVAHQYRIVSAEVKDIKAARPLYSVDYTYSEDGKLEESTVAAIPNPDKPDKTEHKPPKSAAHPVPIAPVAAR